MKQIQQNTKLILSVATVFVLINALNLLNTSAYVAFYWKLFGAVGVVLFIASLKVDEVIEPSSTGKLAIC